MSNTPNRQESSKVGKKKRILLIGWDGADWQHITPLLDAGKMPTLSRLVDQGVIGNLATMQPVFSPMLWNTIATGKLPDQHGICGFMEPDPTSGGARPVTSLSRKVKAIWNIFSQSGLKSNVVGWWASHPAEPINGSIVSQSIKFGRRKDNKLEFPLGTVHPADRLEELSESFVESSELLPADLLSFIPKARELQLGNHKLLAPLSKLVTECATLQSVTTQLMADDDWDFTAIYLDTIDHACHSFMAYYPPKMPFVDEKEFEIFKHVIDGFYQFHDMMLARLWDLAGPDTLVIVCSDHGFESGKGRPMMVSNEPAGPADWHREFGILAMAGPGIKKDERVYGANLIDITPTILTYAGLPIGQDMKGRPLVSIFKEPPEVKTIPSWETELGNGDPGLHPPGTELEERQSDELRKQFVALGYVEDHGEDKEQASKAAQTELDYNLARTYMGTNRPDEAIPLLEALLWENTWELRFIFKLAYSYFQSGYFRQSLDLIEKTFPDDKLPVPMRLLAGRAWFALGERERGLNFIQQVATVNPSVPQAHIRLGRAFFKHGNLSQAKSSFQRAIEVNPEKALAHQGLANVCLKQKRYKQAAEAALDAVALLHHLPNSHYILGIALARLGNYERAAQAFETACHLDEGMLNAHRYLIRIYKRYLGDKTKSDFHLREFLRCQESESQQSVEQNQRAEQLFPLPDIPGHDERLALLKKNRPQPEQKKKSGRTLTLVSGLPRSGTSLIMQMLAAGGLMPMTDKERVADVDNPKGYYEWELIKSLPRDPSILDDQQLDTKVTKVISMLLGSLPASHSYKIIFVSRNTDEIAASQHKMIQRLGTSGADHSIEEIVKQLSSHREQALQYLEQKPFIDHIVVDYSELIAGPADAITVSVHQHGYWRCCYSE